MMGVATSWNCACINRQILAIAMLSLEWVVNNFLARYLAICFLFYCDPSSLFKLFISINENVQFNMLYWHAFIAYA